MSDLNDIKETIRNLRARASDSGSSEAEAMAAIAKADKLMQKHGITVEDLKNEASHGGIVRSPWTKNTKKLHPAALLAHAITLLTETKGWEQTAADGEKAVVFMGFEADVEYALYLCDLVHNAMESEWTAFREGPVYDDTPRSMRSRMREDFMRGMAARIREKIMGIVSERRTQAPEIANTGTGLVVAKRNMIAAAMEDAGVDPRARRKSKGRKVGADAYYSGVAAGNRTTITTGIGENVSA